MIEAIHPDDNLRIRMAAQAFQEGHRPHRKYPPRRPVQPKHRASTISAGGHLARQMIQGGETDAARIADACGLTRSFTNTLLRRHREGKLA